MGKAETGLVLVDPLGKPVRPELYSDSFRRLTLAARLGVIHLYLVRRLSPWPWIARAWLQWMPLPRWPHRAASSGCTSRLRAFQTLDGRWLSIDGSVLFKANVVASEAYNTALEQHLRETLGVAFAERLGTDPAKRPIREIVGVDPRLNQRWSTRRAHINTRRGELAIQFHNDHGRPPTPVEALYLAQQANLETRDAKHEPRSLAEQRATWLSEAAAVLGSPQAVASMVRTALTPPAGTAPIADSH